MSAFVELSERHWVGGHREIGEYGAPLGGRVVVQERQSVCREEHQRGDGKERGGECASPQRSRFHEGESSLAV
jgi:hypothetical protein